MRAIALLLLLLACSSGADERENAADAAYPSVARAIADVEAAKADAAKPPPIAPEPNPEAPPSR
ncbi:hypothetical protein [Thermaurantiacus sp.]